MIERLSPGTRKIELFGRPHNIQPNWITLGNQVDGIRLVDPSLIENFKKRYPTDLVIWNSNDENITLNGEKILSKSISFSKLINFTQKEGGVIGKPLTAML
ncbi:hypothetical protein NQ317_000150 [Molorchus minor]|uniref:mRNA m(6)A methyltransferase n=1 Tax=Molorchus minor TaxID=1323400 RepID=A0ABQ9JGI3_9CUCU|nr:hypothetical protein NQ317_000150 [Molorchus minor]